MDRRALLLCAGAGLLAGCTVPETTPRFPDLTFTNRTPLNLEVARLDVVDAYQPPMAPPNVEHLAPVAPNAVAERWAHDVLKAVGTAGRAQFVVLEGSLVETPLPRTSGLTGMVTTDQSERYDATVAGRLELFDAADRPLGQAQARVSGYQTVAEDATLNDRQRVWYALVETTVREFADAMEIAVRRDLGRYVR